MNWSALIAALIAFETSQTTGLDKVPDGDGGRAHGCLQMHQCVIDDVNRIHLTNYSLRHAEVPQTARTICKLYLDHYVKQARSGWPNATRTITDHELAARIWNGGPDGWRKTATLNYWNHVKNLLADGR